MKSSTWVNFHPHFILTTSTICHHWQWANFKWGFWKNCQVHVFCLNNNNSKFKRGRSLLKLCAKITQGKITLYQVHPNKTENIDKIFIYCTKISNRLQMERYTVLLNSLFVTMYYRKTYKWSLLQDDKEWRRFCTLSQDWKNIRMLDLPVVRRKKSWK